MAKELLIVFVYDCELCKKEEDDPQDAIIYFYPSWVSAEQRHALCSQLMGVTQFCSQNFALPKIIALQSGKFSIRKLGKYAVCVGTDRNIPDMVLETRSNILSNLLRLFHKDIESLQLSLIEEEEGLSDKLAELLHVYLPILQYATNTFGNIPILKLPKSSSSVFLEAMQTLQSFQEIPGVLGGILLYQNKVVATQIDCNLTKQLVVTDPYRIKLPVQNVATPFHLPVGVQLLNIFIPSSEVNRLRSENQQLLSALKEVAHWRNEIENSVSSNPNKTGGGCPPDSSTSTYGGMKRDVSRIFTVPEEDPEAVTSPPPPPVPDLVRDAVKARHLARLDTVQTSSFLVPTQFPVKKHAATTDDMVNAGRISIRYYSLGLPSMQPDWFDRESSPSKLRPRPYYNSICDPKYPLFKMDGLPASYSLCESRLTGHYEGLKSETATQVAKLAKKPPRPASIGLKTEENCKVAEAKQKLAKAKRSFTLPLKSTTGTSSHGVALTPLMAKLSLLAEEGDRLETPLKTPRTSLPKDVAAKTPFKPTLPPPLAGSEAGEPIVEKNVEDALVEVVLYVFGVNNTSLLLLIEPTSSTDPDIIHSLWERSMSQAKHCESRVTAWFETAAPETGTASSSDYSYAVVEPGWGGPVERGGPYQPHHLELLTSLHHVMSLRPTLTDIILRSEDTLSYGYQCGGKQVFYQESCNSAGGLPTPADLMGLIPLKARRVLERDHGVLLL